MGLSGQHPKYKFQKLPDMGMIGQQQFMDFKNGVFVKRIWLGLAQGVLRPFSPHPV